jgi:cytochrome c oxidase assembly factor CtaG
LGFNIQILLAQRRDFRHVIFPALQLGSDFGQFVLYFNNAHRRVQAYMPDLFANFFAVLYEMPLSGVILWSVLENVIIFVVVILIGEWLVRRYRKHRITENPEPLSRQEVLLAASCVILNAVVTRS